MKEESMVGMATVIWVRLEYYGALTWVNGQMPEPDVYWFRCILSNRNSDGRRLVDLVEADHELPAFRNGDGQRVKLLSLLHEGIQAQTDLMVAPVKWNRVCVG